MKKNYKKNYKKTDLLKDLKMSLSNFSFIMIYTIHKILVLTKNHLNYLKDSIFEYTFNFFKNIIFSITYSNGNFKS